MSEEKQLVEEFYTHLIRQGSLIKVSATGTIRIDEEVINSKNALMWLQGKIRNTPQFTPLLLQEIPQFLAHLRVTHAVAIRSRPTYDEVEIRHYDYTGLIPFQSVTDSNRYAIFDTLTSSVMDLDFKTFKEAMERVEPIRGRIEFNPYFPQPITFREDQYGRPCNYLNIYKKPEWQDDKNLINPEEESFSIPPIFDRFFKQLFPREDAREYVLDWLHYALTDRCETYLVLNGAKGIGKNIFSEYICKGLMGANNHKMAQTGALETNFGALLKDCRMIILDEVRVDTAEKVNRLKRFVNEDQMLEFKGVDVDATTKTFNSFIISNNLQDDMKAISWDDRRFSVMEMTKEKLRDSWKDREIRAVVDACQDMDIMREFGYYIMYRKPKTSKYEPFKKDHFYALCYNSFTEWQKVIIDLATSKLFREISHADLKKEYRKRTEGTRLPSYSKIKDFIENYRHLGVHSIGDISRQTHDAWIIELSEEFCGEDSQLLGEDLSGEDLLA